MASLKETLAKQKAKQAPISVLAESTLLIDQITDRPSGDTRPLNLAHIEALAESIAAVGLIQPIAVDSKGRLLAGGHRRAAISLLKDTNPMAYTQWFSNGVQVRCYDFDAIEDEALALAIEATENEKRRDYTSGEVRELADRLVAAGYHHTKGQPKKGAKALMPALETIVGKSRRQLQRYLSDEPVEINAPCDALLSDINSTVRSLNKLLKQEEILNNQALSKDIIRLLKKLEDLK